MSIPSFALARSLGMGAVHVDGGAIEEVAWLLGPDFQARFVDDVHEDVEVGTGEATAEVASRCRIGNAVCVESVEEDLIIAAQFDVL
jgi:hypothetical protein